MCMIKQETKFKDKVRKDLKTLSSCWFFKTQETSIRGIPDYILCLRGWFIALELKPEADIELDALQEYNIKCIIEDGEGIGMRVDPTNWPQTFKNLQSISQGVAPELLAWPK